MPYFGDININDTIDFKFTTVSTTGAPTELTGTPVIAAYVGNNATQILAGITLSTNFDGVTGLNNVRVVATTTNGYGLQTNVELTVNTGTVGGASVVGYRVGGFSIANRNVPVTVSTNQDKTGYTVQTNSDKTGYTVQTVQDKTGYTLGSFTIPVTVGTNNDKVGYTVSTNQDKSGYTVQTNQDKTGYTVQTVQDKTGYTLGSFTIPVTVGTNTDKTGYTVSTNSDKSGYTVSTNQDKTGYTVSTNSDKSGYAIGVGGIVATSFGASAIDSAALAQNACQEIADEILNRNIAGSGSGNTRNVRNALRALRNRVDTAGGLTVYEEDDTTPAWTGVITRSTSAANITQVDPA